MEEVTEKEKKTLMQKFLGFQKKGLISYGKFLTQQHKYASESEIRKAYKKYIEDQLEMNRKKISEIDEKLK